MFCKASGGQPSWYPKGGEGLHTCVRISSTSLNPILVSASLLCSIMTMLLLCSETCFEPPAALRVFLVNCCSWAIC